MITGISIQRNCINDGHMMKIEDAVLIFVSIFFVLMFVSRVVETREDQPGGGVVVTR